MRFALFAFLACCTCINTPVPEYGDAGSGDVVVQACSRMSYLKCPEGVATNCVDITRKMLQAGINPSITTESLHCVAAASSKAEVSGCSKSIQCK